MKEIAALGTRSVVVERNEYIKVGGSVDSNIYYIESGSVRAFVVDDVVEQNIRFGYAGNLIVALDSFITAKPSPLFIQAIKRSTVRVITKSDFDLFLKEPENQTRWVSILEELVKQQLEREIDILTTSPKERYLRVLQRSPQLFQEIPSLHIANYLRMSPETLSRLKKY
ncbi:MAG: Crp/Fnr family transcriptional regulator [Flavobacteriales bacterium]|jgi:CRP-like cAMP-binding protein